MRNACQILGVQGWSSVNDHLSQVTPWGGPWLWGETLPQEWSREAGRAWAIGLKARRRGLCRLPHDDSHAFNRHDFNGRALVNHRALGNNIHAFTVD